MDENEKIILQPAYQDYLKTGSGQAAFAATNNELLIICINTLTSLEESQYINMLSGNLHLDGFHIVLGSQILDDVVFEYQLTSEGIGYCRNSF